MNNLPSEVHARPAPQRPVQKRQIQLLKILAGVAAVMVAVYLMLNELNDTTELIPDHENVATVGLIFGGLGALSAVIVVFLRWEQLAVAQRIRLAPGFCIDGLSCVVYGQQ